MPHRSNGQRPLPGINRRSTFWKSCGATLATVKPKRVSFNAPSEAFVYAERSKARSFLELLYEASIGVTKGMNPALIDEEHRLYGTLFEIRKVLQQSLTEAQRATLMAEHHTREQELAILKQKIRSTN